MRLSTRMSGYTTLAERHCRFRLEEEWRKPRGDVRERKHIRMKLDPEDVRHEAPPLFDPLPGGGVSRGERAPERLIRDRDAVLDVRREVRRSRRRDDVDL